MDNKISVLNKISKDGLEILTKEGAVIETTLTDEAEAILVRSYDLNSTALGKNLLAIGRAGAGVNNIPVDLCSKQGIVVFNTPGANANAVKELVIGSLFLAARNLVPAINFLKNYSSSQEKISEVAEKNKSKFAGSEILGKTLGVIGLGAIGNSVANDAINLGMSVIGYDPFISVDQAWNVSREVKKAKNLDEVLKNSDYITLHVPLNDQTKGIICKKNLDLAKKGVVILNFARGQVIIEDDLLEAINNGKVAGYITDFASEKFLANDKVICIPHLGASTSEAEENCAIMIANQIKDFLANGNILNSVNLPNCSIERTGETRLTVINENIPNMVSQITLILAEEQLNIMEMVNKSKGNIAYNIVDFNGKYSSSLIEKLNAISGIIKVRLINP